MRMQQLQDLSAYSCKLANGDCYTCSYHNCYYCRAGDICTANARECEKDALQHHWQCPVFKLYPVGTVALLVLFLALGLLITRLLKQVAHFSRRKSFASR